jgi:hypothetical protein
MNWPFSRPLEGDSGNRPRYFLPNREGGWQTVGLPAALVRQEWPTIY